MTEKNNEKVNLYYETHGRKNGKPIVIMDAGYGDYSKAWASIYPSVSKSAQVFLYDRAGMGRSPYSPNPRTSLFMVEELRSVLKRENFKPPYILVGHSYGGVNMRIFANLYPQEVVGLLLIDSTPGDYREVFLPTMSDAFKAAYEKQFIHEGNYDEFEESLNQLKQTQKQVSVPFIVLSAGKKEHYSTESQLLWNKMQADILQFTTNGHFQIAENSTHYIQRDQPELVITSIESLILRAPSESNDA